MSKHRDILAQLCELGLCRLGIQHVLNLEVNHAGYKSTVEELAATRNEHYAVSGRRHGLIGTEPTNKLSVEARKAVVDEACRR